MTAKEFSHSVNAIMQDFRPMALKFTKNSEDANDLMQETLLKALTNRNKFALGTNLRAWLYTIMKNSFITQYQKRLKSKNCTSSLDYFHFLNNMDVTTGNYGESSFAVKDMLKAINNLDETFKTPFLLYFRGYKYDEIAEKLDAPMGTVKNRIHMARKQLKEKLVDYQY